MAINRTDVYATTAKGENELKGGATSLSSRELELMVLIDGKKQVATIAGQAAARDPAGVMELLEKLLLNGFIRPARPADASDGGLEYFFDAGKRPADPSEQATAKAEEEALSGSYELREQGYYVSIARRARGTDRVSGAARTMSVLVIEDEPLVAKYLKALVEMEGFSARCAANRAEIVAELRQASLPDLVMLDVMLPDTNGFEVLQRMKSYPLLSEIPVIMVTTQATREGVMKGLALGADGYVTKPFEVDVLLRGMKAVLGLLPPEHDSLVPGRVAPWKSPGGR